MASMFLRASATALVTASGRPGLRLVGAVRIAVKLRWVSSRLLCHFEEFGNGLRAFCAVFGGEGDAEIVTV